MLSKTVQERQPNKVKGGIGGIGKSARSLLHGIVDGQHGFKDAFNTTDGAFVIARKEGKRAIKTGVYK